MSRDTKRGRAQRGRAQRGRAQRGRALELEVTSHPAGQHYRQLPTHRCLRFRRRPLLEERMALRDPVAFSGTRTEFLSMVYALYALAASLGVAAAEHSITPIVAMLFVLPILAFALTALTQLGLDRVLKARLRCALVRAGAGGDDELYADANGLWRAPRAGSASWDGHTARSAIADFRVAEGPLSTHRVQARLRSGEVRTVLDVIEDEADAEWVAAELTRTLAAR